MSFSIRLALSLALLVLCTAAAGAAGLIALGDLHGRLGATDEQYQELRGLYEVGHRAAVARLLLDSAAPDESEARRQMLMALRETERLLATTGAPVESDANLVGASPAEHGRRVGGGLIAALENIRSNLQAALIADPTGTQPRSLMLNTCLSAVGSLAADANRDIAAARLASTRRVATARWILGVVLCTTLVLAVTLGLSQLRAIARPLRVLRRGVEGVADRRHSQPISEVGPREFRELIAQFNRMSATIADLEASLTQQVETRNRQLIRSERLAGLGYLAAGLAHEINTPLGVIGGYAETMLRRLDGNSALDGDVDAPQRRAEAAHDLAEALRVISEEVFRCQDITSGLLQMTRLGEERSESIDLRALIERVVHMLSRLPLCNDRRLLIEHSSAAPLLARGVRSQLTQVFLNLITNALEAVEPLRGEVRITVGARTGMAVIAVYDNGCGMTAGTMARVFDPLFTDKPQRGQAGLGLGLSVSHAIVERHGGRIDVHSDGPGAGSAFTVELPAISALDADARERAAMSES